VEWTRTQKPGRFDTLSGRESPARSALFLVLHAGNSTLASPVIRFRNSVDITFTIENRAVKLEARGLVTHVLNLEFSRSHVTEFVDGVLNKSDLDRES
jgi:hypothetical protein